MFTLLWSSSSCPVLMMAVQSASTAKLCIESIKKWPVVCVARHELPLDLLSPESCLSRLRTRTSYPQGHAYSWQQYACTVWHTVASWSDFSHIVPMNVRPVDKLPSRLGKMPGLLHRLLSNACTTGARVSYQTAPAAPTFEQAQASEHDSRLLETLRSPFPGATVDPARTKSCTWASIGVW